MEHNQERARILIERMGWERFIGESGMKPVSQSPYGKLYRIPRDYRDREYQVVVVKNSSPEPDGTYKNYVLRVPMTVTTAKEAVACTFGLDGEFYQPTIET
jgi:hypothetical protein